MELCNTTLGHFIKGKYEGQPVGSEKEILFQIARGIEYLTEKGLVNRNINPNTIFISLPDGKIPPKTKLVDFTFSRKLDEGKNELETSEVHQKYGLNHWSAPELLRNEKSYTAAVDVFSAGCVFAYVLSKGKHPFGLYSFRVFNIGSGNLQMPAEITDERAVDLVKKMLTFKPSERITIHQVLVHPFFWDEEKCLTFIQVACKVLEPQAASKSHPSDGPLIAKLEADRNKIFTGNWPDHLTANARQNLFKGVFPMKNKEEVTKSVFFLLKAFRNKVNYTNNY
jgi:serine/threonine-protein kinase/endoribonuclease IRE1